MSDDLVQRLREVDIPQVQQLAWDAADRIAMLMQEQIVLVKAVTGKPPADPDGDIGTSKAAARRRRPCFDCDALIGSDRCDGPWTRKWAHEIGHGAVESCHRCGLQWRAVRYRAFPTGRGWGWRPVRHRFTRRLVFAAVPPEARAVRRTACPNCDGRLCMDCVLRVVHDECDDRSCPECKGAGEIWEGDQ